MPTLQISPPYPVAGQETIVTFSGLNSSTNYVKLYVQSAPLGSDERTRVDSAKLSDIVFETKPGGQWNFAPEKAGVYTFIIEELTIQPRSGARFQGDSRGAPDPAIVARSSASLSIGEKLTLKIGQSPNACRLKVFVWGETILSTNLEQHSEISPILEGWESQAAENAALASDVVAAVAALADQPVSTILGSFTTDFETVRASVGVHMMSTSAHSTADTDRVLGTGYAVPDASSASTAITALRLALEQHMRTVYVQNPVVVSYDPMSPPSPDETHSAADGTTYFQVSGPGESRATQLLALADVVVALNVHRQLPTVHLSPETPSTPSLSPLLSLIVKFLKALRLATPVTPSERNSGAALLQQLGGFERS